MNDNSNSNHSTNANGGGKSSLSYQYLKYDKQKNLLLKEPEKYTTEELLSNHQLLEKRRYYSCKDIEIHFYCIVTWFGGLFNDDRCPILFFV